MKLYWDIDEAKLVTDMNNPQPVTELTWVVRDLVPVELRTVRRAESGSNYYELVDLAAGRSPFLGAKPSTAMDGLHLVSGPTWIRTGTGVYTATIALRQENLIAASNATASLSLVGELTQVDEAGDNYSSTQFTLYIVPDVTRGSETPMAGIYAACLVVQVVEDGQKVILIQNTDGVVYQRLTAPGV